MDAHQTSIYTAILITALIVGGILVFFIFSLVRQQKRNNALYKAKILAEITTLENERARVANDLHDELGPLLSAIKFKLSSIETHLPEDELVMQQTSEHIVDIISRMREISNDLMPNTLIRKGLVYAIDEFIGKLGNGITHGETIHGLTISFFHQDVPELPKNMAINIYRIVQEIIHNTIKHAKASRLRINISVKDNKLVLQTEDNGTGFDYNDADRTSTGFGLRNLVSRSEIMGGDLYIDSKKGKGTIYTIEIPV